jgi:hypothetical protein
MGFLLLEGNVYEAFRTNPFLVLLVAALGAWTVAGLVLRLAGRDLGLDVSAREEKWWWVVLIAGFLVNWAYLWWAGV